jgi:dTDP-4-dehydrorhamnose reductase
MRHVVLGANGQLGRDLCPRLPGEVVALSREQADLTRPDQLRQTLKELQPGIVINCAAYNFVDRAHSEWKAAFAVNAEGVWVLAQTCNDLGCTLVHFSTDYVFGKDATRRQPWTEDDLPEPVNAYGITKLTGEQLVQFLCPRHVIVRTCGLYGLWGSGGKGGNFVETMLRLAGQGKPIRVVNDQICTPSSTADVADATVALLAAGGQGLYHVTNAGACSWYEFAAAIFRLAGVTASLTPISSQEYGSAARRPAYSVLASQRWRELGLAPLRNWEEALADYLHQRHRQRS